MTALRQRMIEDLKLAGYWQRTPQAYAAVVDDVFEEVAGGGYAVRTVLERWSYGQR